MKAWSALLFLATMNTAWAETLPLPPMPPRHPPSEERAPVPNLETAEPAEPDSGQPTVDVRLYRAHSYDPSMGFTPGSRYQTTEERKPIQTPGVSLTVPLQ